MRVLLGYGAKSVNVRLTITMLLCPGPSLVFAGGDNGLSAAPPVRRCGYAVLAVRTT